MECSEQFELFSPALERVRAMMVGRDRADRVAEVLLQNHDVHEVLLFGSLARNGRGRDIDLIVITDEWRSDQFMRTALTEMQEIEEHAARLPIIADRIRNGAYGHKQARQAAAIEAIEGFEWELDVARSIAYPASIDIFVFPTDWRNRLEVLQLILPHHDPHFMQNIARDAMSLGRNPR